MALYEHVLLARQDISAQQVEELVTGFSQIITDNGGTIKKNEYWGLKSLTYRIKKNRKAHYSLLNLDASPAAVKEMERQMGLNEDILRFMTIRVEAHEDGPSAMMKKIERDEKLERGAYDAIPSFNESRPARSGGGRFKNSETADIESGEA